MRKAFETGLSAEEKRLTAPNFYAISGLSANPHATCTRKPLRILQNIWNRGKIRRQPLIIWHDLINNCLGKHRSNGGVGQDPDELVDILKSNKRRIAAIVYTQRIGTPNIFNKLTTTKIPILDAKKHLISKKKFRDPALDLQRDLRQLHPSVKLEAKLFLIVWRRRSSPQSFIQVKKQKRKRLSKSRRDKKKLAAKANEAS